MRRRHAVLERSAGAAAELPSWPGGGGPEAAPVLSGDMPAPWGYRGEAALEPNSTAGRAGSTSQVLPPPAHSGGIHIWGPGVVVSVHNSPARCLARLGTKFWALGERDLSPQPPASDVNSGGTLRRTPWRTASPWLGNFPRGHPQMSNNTYAVGCRFEYALGSNPASVT